MAPIAGRLRGSSHLSWRLKKATVTLSNRPLRSDVAACFSTSVEPSSSTAKSQEKEKWRWSGLLLFIPGAATFGLGTWQLYRRQKKIELLEHRQSRLDQDPVPLTSSMLDAPGSESDANGSPLEFRRVLCEGVYDESRSIYIGPRSRSISGVTENGYYVVTPLMPAQKKNESVQLHVLVNRGWVPRSWRDKYFERSHETRPLSDVSSSVKENPKGSSWWNFWVRQPVKGKDEDPDLNTVKVIGVVRGSENPSIFMPPNDPDSGQWFYVDVPAMARAVGLPENTLYVEEIEGMFDASKPYPLPKDVRAFIQFSVMPQDHLNYTFTWYSLSAATTFMAAKRLQKKNIPR